jgi:FkbM family methyltransferase
MADSWKLRLRRALNGLLHPVGLHLARRERAFEMSDLLASLAKHGPEIKTWIDVGASDGSWSRHARQHYPGARFLLFEPLAERQAALQALRQEVGFEIAPVAAGAARGTVAFAVDPALDGSSVAPTGTADARTVEVDTIDAVTASRGLVGPFGLKLDTHGYELAVLEGASRTLAAAEVLIIEAYNFQLTPGSLRFHELCTWLEARGFRCCGLADPMCRPANGVLWQIDLAFARANSPLFRSNRYD